MRSNKTLYNSIMRDVAKTVKQHLSEAKEAKTDVEVAADALIADLKKYHKKLEYAIELMKIISKGHEKEVDYKDVTYDKLIPELEKRLKEKTINDNYRVRK